MHQVAIVGGGQGGRNLLSALVSISSIQIVGIADIQPEAPAFSLARQLGIPTTTDTDSLVARTDLDVIFEATGKAEVLEHIRQMKAPATQVVGAESAQIMMELVRSRDDVSQSLLQRARAMERLIEEVAEVSQRISHAVQTLQESSVQLAASGQSLSAAAGQTQTSLGEVEEVLDFVRQVANKTRMIGLNAAIEAARVGEQGRGFGVVASEVRKLAQTSNESAENISRSVQQTLDAVKQIFDGVVSSHQVAEDQAQATAELNTALEELSKMVAQLGIAARQLVS